MTKNRKSPASKEKGQTQSKQALPTSNRKADFTPTITDETQEGKITVIVSGVQPPKKAKAAFTPVITDITEQGNIEVWVRGQQQPPKISKAAFEPTVIDETVEGECIGIIGVSRPPKKTSQ